MLVTALGQAIAPNPGAGPGSNAASNGAAIAPMYPIKGEGDGGSGGSGSSLKANSKAVVVSQTKNDVSPPLRQIRAKRPTPRSGGSEEGPENLSAFAGKAGLPKMVDGALQVQSGSLQMPTPTANFEGVAFYDSVPPDPNGDVGPDHYVQWVNREFQIFTKTGASVYGPAAGNVLWTGFGGICENLNDGDPIVQYDQIAGRWLMSQFAGWTDGSNGYYQCVAVSQTSDPTSSYNRYAFFMSNTLFNDYPKFGVWPDAYYMSIVNFQNHSYAGLSAIAFDRAAMLDGHPATFQRFDLPNTYLPILPSDLDGKRLPPAGAPNNFATFSPPNTLQIWKYHVDWSNPAQSTFTGPTHVVVAPYDTRICDIPNSCINQPVGGHFLNAMTDRPLYRLAYRNMGDHESLLFNHTVATSDVNAYAAPRWYELRNVSNPSQAPTVYQQGTFSPDGTERWMGSMAMDNVGNIALGYSASDNDLYPAIRYTGRLAGDPLGQMTGNEVTIMQGNGAQVGNERWGDYSSMSVDPVDDCTFWYTNEYYPVTSGTNWRTRIASFRFPNCTPFGTATPVPTSTAAPTATATRTATPIGTPTADAYALLQPGGEITVTVGSKLAFDLKVNGGSNSVVAAQSYLTFTQSILQSVVPDGGVCSLADSLQPDTARFDTVLQNEVCNGAVPCDFSGRIAPPGSIAFASASLANAPATGAFRVARVAFCANSTGRAVVNWQLPPSAPPDRRSEIADVAGNNVADPARYASVVINVVSSAPSPGPTSTATYTAIATATATATRTATATNTAMSTATATATSTRTSTATSTPTSTGTASATATASASHTATATPTPVLVGHVVWQGRPAQPNALQQLPITLTLQLASGGPLHTFPNNTTDSNGLFTVGVATLPTGSYNWWVKGPQFLAASGTVTLSGASSTQAEMGLMKVGDVNNDNIVDIADFGVMRGTFGKSCGNPTFDPRADLNGDCTVDIGDFSLLRANFGQSGVPPQTRLGEKPGQSESGGIASPTPASNRSKAYIELRVSGKKLPGGDQAFKVGETITVELWLHPGTESGIIGQQTYLTFSREYVQAALLTADTGVFDVTLLSEACNEGACLNGSTQSPPGTIAFASAAMSNPPASGRAAFKVGEIKFKGTAPGQARLQWKMGDDGAHNTRIAGEHGVLTLERKLFKDIVINVVK